MEVLKVSLENRVKSLETQNENLKVNGSLLTSDLQKKNSDYLALTKKLNADYFEHQKEFSEFRESSVLEPQERDTCTQCNKLN